MIKNFFMLISLFCNSFLFCVDLDYFEKFVGTYEAIEVESYKWEDRDGTYIKTEDEYFHPEKLIVEKEVFEADDIDYRIEYNNRFFMRIDELSAKLFDQKTNEILITENSVADKIVFLTDDLIRIKIIWKDENCPCGISYYESILYHRVKE